MSKLIRRTKKNFGAALLIALQLITLTLAGLLMPWGTSPQQSANGPAVSQTSPADTQTQADTPTAHALTAADKANLRSSAHFGKKLYEPLASQVFDLATSRAESAGSGRQAAQQSMQEGELPNAGRSLTTVGEV